FAADGGRHLGSTQPMGAFAADGGAISAQRNQRVRSRRMAAPSRLNATNGCVRGGWGAPSPLNATDGCVRGGWGVPSPLNATDGCVRGGWGAPSRLNATDGCVRGGWGAPS